MATIEKQRVPIMPGSSPVPIIGPNNIFYPIKYQKCNLNEKYMFTHDQFRDRSGPILKFFAYFDNRGVCPRDAMKFRKCEVFYYVEDGTIKVFEPRQKNAGFTQGCLIRRNKIPKPDGGYYELGDLNIGKQLVLYGKAFKLLDCDPFTKNYLKEMGYRVGCPEPDVVDPVYADRLEMDARHRITVKKPRNKVYKLAEFYKSHPKCLHFYVIYNNKPGPFDEIRYASLYYSISDHTIKIIDENKLQEYRRQLSMGNYDTYLILKPTLVPKTMVGVNPVGKDSSPIILNLNAISRHKTLQDLTGRRSGGSNNLAGFIVDSNPESSYPECFEYYKAEDFDLGVTLEVFGYEVYIYDCDEFTKEFYRNEFNRELTPVQLPELKRDKYPTLVYKGNFGNPEDSLQTCRQMSSLNTPKQLTDAYVLSQTQGRKGRGSDSLLNFYLNCRLGCDSKVLTYLSEIISDSPFLVGQYFMIRCYLEDETIDIAGMDLNSTSTVWMFLKRMKLTKPSSEGENSGPCYYRSKDMYVGNVVYASRNPFLIIDADEYTLDYMERNCDVFIHSNIKYVMERILPVLRNKASDLKSAWGRHDLGNTGFVSYNNFKAVLIDLVPEDFRKKFPEQQIKTLARHFACEEYVGLKIEHLISRIQTELKRHRFEDFEKLELLFRLFDVDNDDHQGHFNPARVYEILRSYPLVIERDLLKSFVFKFPKCNELISYEEIVKSLNYIENPAKPPDLTPYAININWKRIETMKDLNKICYFPLLKALTIEKCPNCI